MSKEELCTTPPTATPKTHSEFVFIKMKSYVSESKKKNQLEEIDSSLGKKLFQFSLLIGIFGFLNLCKKRNFIKY